MLRKLFAERRLETQQKGNNLAEITNDFIFSSKNKIECKWLRRTRRLITVVVEDEKIDVFHKFQRRIRRGLNNPNSTVY